MDYSPYLGLGIAAVVLAGFFQGLTSFGFALIAMPVLAKIIPIQEAVPIVVALSLITNVLILKDGFRFVDLRKIWPLILASFVAAPLGTYSLLLLNADILKLLTGILVVLFAAVLLAGLRFPIRRERFAFAVTGALSGFLNGSISLSGPPVALFLSNQGVDRHVFRANITAYALLLNVVTLISFAATGLMSKDVIKLSAWLLPGMLIGLFIGIKLIRNLDEALFRKIALCLISVSGIWTLASALDRLVG